MKSIKSRANQVMNDVNIWLVDEDYDEDEV